MYYFVLPHWHWMHTTGGRERCTFVCSQICEPYFGFHLFLSSAPLPRFHPQVFDAYFYLCWTLQDAAIFFTFLREEPLWMWPSSRIVQNSFQRIKQKVKEFKEATDKTLVWANTMTAMLSKKLWSAMFNVYSSFAYTRWNLPPRLVSENQKGRLKNNPEAIIEVCTLLYPVSKMIIIEIQISIQRSSRWATNWYEVCPTAFSSPQQALTIPLHPGNYQEQVHLHPGTLSIEPPALPLIGFTVMDFLNSILIRNTNTKYYTHTITDAKHQIVCKTSMLLPNTGWSKAMNLLLV